MRIVVLKSPKMLCGFLRKILRMGGGDGAGKESKCAFPALFRVWNVIPRRTCT